MKITTYTLFIFLGLAPSVPAVAHSGLTPAQRTDQKSSEKYMKRQKNAQNRAQKKAQKTQKKAKKEWNEQHPTVH